ncbi:antitoxin [Hydrocarboniphaga sp.]|uniref:antitoxin n=1 Tax=Hydrocarboniphaga sp. TaxID=2033016 RepID=UPI003D0F9F7D
MTAMKTAKLFKNGRSQAVRLPAEFRFDGHEVLIERRGDAVILRPKPGNLAESLKAYYDVAEPFPDDYLRDRGDAPPQHRDWFDESES